MASARGRLALLSRACSPLVVPARSLSVGFYRQARLPELSLASVDEASSGGSERLNDVRAATRSLLAPHPMGLRRDEYLEAMRREFGVRVGADRAGEAKFVRALARRMPDVMFAPDGAGVYARKVDAKFVYPAYYPRLKRSPRTASDYEEATPAGAAAFRQLRDAIATLLELHPKGLRSRTLLLLLQKRYSHTLDAALAQHLVSRMPDMAAWHASEEYAEYDAVRPAKPPPPPPRPSSVRSRKEAWREAVRQRFLKWYDDPPA